MQDQGGEDGVRAIFDEEGDFGDVVGGGAFGAVREIDV